MSAAMTCRKWQLLIAVTLAAACLIQSPLKAQAGKVSAPFAVLLPDDEETRGDWIGTYGRYGYVLCGMRAPSSLRGGYAGNFPFSASTGDPDETARAWHSSAPATQDRSVLLEPSGIKRTPAAFDDHGEVRPLGQGPDLHIRMHVSPGPFLVCLYFFEVDWIQYRSYRMKVFAEELEGKVLLESSVDHFFKGKYKRFLVYGPVNLLVVIERGNSPNAQVSGVFVDGLSFPDLCLFLMARGESAEEEDISAESTLTQVAEAEHAAEEALTRLLESGAGPDARTQYIQEEKEYFLALQGIQRRRPEEYYSTLTKLIGPLRVRLDKAEDRLAGTAQVLDAKLLGYYAARAECDYPGAIRKLGQVADLLLAGSVESAGGDPARAGLLERFARHLMEQGRRAEASVVLEAYASYCLEQGTAEFSRQLLIDVADDAIRAGVTLPIARALSAWRNRYGELPAEGRLVLANLYYVAGKNAEAFEMYRTVEPEIDPGTRHRWVLIAMMTALLRADRFEEAMAILERLRTAYPESPELEDAEFRLGAHHFDGGDLRKARECFEHLRSSTNSGTYQQMCQEYIERIEHLEQIKEGGGGK